MLCVGVKKEESFFFKKSRLLELPRPALYLPVFVRDNPNNKKEEKDLSFLRCSSMTSDFTVNDARTLEIATFHEDNHRELEVIKSKLVDALNRHVYARTEKSIVFVLAIKARPRTASWNYISLQFSSWLSTCGFGISQCGNSLKLTWDHAVTDQDPVTSLTVDNLSAMNVWTLQHSLSEQLCKQHLQECFSTIRNAISAKKTVCYYTVPYTRKLSEEHRHIRERIKKELHKRGFQVTSDMVNIFRIKILWDLAPMSTDASQTASHDDAEIAILSIYKEQLTKVILAGNKMETEPENTQIKEEYARHLANFQSTESKLAHLLRKI